MTGAAGMKEYLAEVARFARREIEPGLLEADARRDPAWLARIWEKSWELELPGLADQGPIEDPAAPGLLCARALECIASSCPGAASLFALHFAAAAVLVGAGEGFAAAAGGEPAAPFALVLPDPSRDMDLCLSKNGDGFVLSGETNLAANTSLAEWAIIFIQEKGSPETAGCVLADLSAPGVFLGPDAWLPGLCANPFRRIAFENVTLPAERVLPASAATDNLLSLSRGLFFAYVAALASGCLRRAREKSNRYARGRYQFGKMIIKHSEIRRMLGKMQMRIFTADAAMSGLFVGEPFRPADALAAKVFATDAALLSATDAVQVHGGYGYMHEYGIEKIMRDAKTIQLLGGPNPHLLAASIAC